MRKYILLSIVLLAISCGTEPETNTNFSITTSVSPANSGQVTHTPSGTEGTIVTFTATPVDGYVFKEWQGDLTGTTNPNTITLSKNMSVTGVFEEVVEEAPFTITVHEIDLEGKTMFPSKKIKWLENAFHSTVYYRYQGEEYMFSNGGTNWTDASDLQSASILLKKENNKWVFKRDFELDITSEFRNTDFFPNGRGIVGCDHGAEVPDLNNNGQNDEWPHGHLFYGVFNSDGIEWTQVSDKKSFYHSCAVGDLNGDGLYDVIGGHLGTRFSDRSDNPHVYLQTPNGFEYVPDYLSEGLHVGYFVQIDNIVGDERNEVINWNFAGGDNGDYLVMDIQTPDENGVYRLYNEYLDDRLSTKSQLYNVYSDEHLQTPGNWLVDFDQDGLLDIAAENDVYDTNVLFNNGDGTFQRVQVVEKGSANGYDRWDGEYLRYEHYYMGYELIDIYNDGFPDLITREPDNYYYDQKGNIYPGDNVWINNGDRTFTRMSERYDDVFKYRPEAVSPFTNSCNDYKQDVGFLKGFVNSDGKFGWYGFLNTNSNCFSTVKPYGLYLIEIVTELDASYVE